MGALAERAEQLHHLAKVNVTDSRWRCWPWADATTVGLWCKSPLRVEPMASARHVPTAVVVGVPLSMALLVMM